VRLVVVAEGRDIGTIDVFPSYSYSGAWQRIHGYSDDERLWSFDIELDTSAQGKGYGPRVGAVDLPHAHRAGLREPGGRGRPRG
jgi:hypothetical protein